jgi:hypothetical protein
MDTEGSGEQGVAEDGHLVKKAKEGHSVMDIKQIHFP